METPLLADRSADPGLSGGCICERLQEQGVAVEPAATPRVAPINQEMPATFEAGETTPHPHSFTIAAAAARDHADGLQGGSGLRAKVTK